MSSDAFRTFQTVQRYEEALARHAQWLRWVSGLTCPCLSSDTGQPDPHCKTCRGRGKIYTSPGRFRMLDEPVRHDGVGKVYPKHPPLVGGSGIVYRKGTVLDQAVVQPPDGSYVQLDPPYPKTWEMLTMDYEHSPDMFVTNENSLVYGTNVLMANAGRFIERGKSFEGSIKSVSRVYNVTRNKTYTVIDAYKTYIRLAGMDSWQSGDVLQVDYVFQKPYAFMLIGITPKLRYQQPYILELADAILITPYWAQVAPDDLFTAMAVEQTGKAIVNPRTSAGNDEIHAYYDLSRLLRVVSASGQEYTVGPGKNVELYGRNELKWNVTKPGVSYVAQFTYHPTYTALDQMHTLRNSENKAFANRVSVKQYDRIHEEVEY